MFRSIATCWSLSVGLSDSECVNFKREMSAECDHNACQEGSLHLACRKTCWSIPVPGKWATTHKRVFFLGKNCSWTLLPGSI